MSEPRVRRTGSENRGWGGTVLSPVIGIALLLVALLAPGSVLVRAQADSFAVGTAVRVANTDGEPLNLRSGPAADQPVVARLAPDEVVTVIDAVLVSDSTRWVPVRTAGGQLGWISDQFIVPVTVAAPVPSPTPDLAAVDAPPLPSPEPMMASAMAAGPAEQQSAPGGPLEVEAKIKFPEAKGRHQEVSIWVTRDGRPIQNATVTMFMPDDEDQELTTLVPTDAEGHTGRDFTLGRTKGSVSMTFTAVAPDGGKGQTEASYFVR